MEIRLSDHFTYARLARFTLHSVVMMIFTSVHGVVDGIFVSNFVGKTPFAAVNLIMPFLMIFGGLGFMVGATDRYSHGIRQKTNSLSEKKALSCGRKMI